MITVELPAEAGELVDKALDRALEAAVPEKPGPEEACESWSARRADALVALAKAYLNGQRENGSGAHYQVTVHVEESALRGGAGRSGLPIETVRRIACDGDLVVSVEDRNGTPLSVGRKTRTVPTALERALWARDRGCRFPGCGRKRYVEAHHIEHWANGGETSLDNLILLCSIHHTLVHEGGFRIEKDYRDRWFFRRPDGRAVPECGYRVEDVTDDGAEAIEEYFGAADAANESAEKPFDRCDSAEALGEVSDGVSNDASAEAVDPASVEVANGTSAEALRVASAEVLTDAAMKTADHASAEVLRRRRSIVAESEVSIL